MIFNDKKIIEKLEMLEKEVEDLKDRITSIGGVMREMRSVICKPKPASKKPFQFRKKEKAHDNK